MLFIVCYTLFHCVLWSTQVLCFSPNTLHYNRHTLWKIPRSVSIQNRTKVTSMINWLEGPFVNDIVVSYDELGSCEQNMGGIHVHDSDNAPGEYVCIPGKTAFDPIALWSFIDSRHELSVKFITGADSTEPLELRWMHFRGNLRLEPLGMNGSPLVIPPGGSARQYTRAGHLFVAMRMEGTQESICLDPLQAPEQHEGFAHLDCLIRRIVGMYLMPAMHQKCTHGLDCSLEVVVGSEQKALYHTNKLALGTSCETTALGDRSYSVHSNATECFRTVLMKYWEHQRLSQVYVNTWAVPTIPVSRLSNSLSFKEDMTPMHQASEVSIDVGGGVSAQDGHNLWTIFDLDPSLTKSVSSFHRSHRRKVNFSSPEPPISLVFNQFEVPTRYVPLPPHLLDGIVEAVRVAAAAWLDMAPEDLLLTGAYGSREYGRGAVVRWHVDPVHSQPLTAIVHLAEECDPRPIPANFSELSADPKPIPANFSEFSNDSRPIPCTFEELCASRCRDLWAIQLPKNLSAEHNYSDYSADAIHSSAWHQVHLKVGQVMLLQSAKLPHARLMPFPGAWYANAFVHFAPVGWEHLEAVRMLS